MRFARATLGILETDEFGQFRRVFGNDHFNTTLGRIYYDTDGANDAEHQGPGEFYASTQWDSEAFDYEAIALDYVLRTYNSHYRTTTRTDDEFRGEVIAAEAEANG